MRKLVAAVTLAALGISLLGAVAFASGSPTVVATFTFVDHGQGGWTGGALLSDGSANGGGALSFANGQVVSMLRPTSWSWAGSSAVDLCFTITDLKGTSGDAGTHCEIVPVTGTPIVVPDPDSGGLATLRVTLVH